MLSGYGGKGMAYELVFHGENPLSIPFALVLFPDQVWDNDWFESTVLITPVRVFASVN